MCGRIALTFMHMTSFVQSFALQDDALSLWLQPMFLLPITEAFQDRHVQQVYSGAGLAA